MMEEVERELCVTRACRHPHVVQVIGLMVGPGRIGIVMELCDTSLAKRIQERSAAINWAETVRLLMDGTAGLGFIHKQKKTTHGDLKPDNLLIQEGRLKVADFGLATVRDSVRQTIKSLTGEVSRKGTTCYMAPEKMLGRVADQPSADVWSFGCVIANVATGRSPFFEDKSEEALLVSLRQKKPVYDKAHVLPGCPQKLLELIDTCTHYDATRRPLMTKVEQELRGVLQSIQSQDGFGLPALWQERGCLLDSPEQLLECQAGSRDHDLIKARLEQEMGNSTTVLKVEMNANVDLLRRYHLERKKVAEENGGDANEVWLWHATSKNGAEKSIVKNGFDLNKCGLKFEYYGAGTYLAPDCKLSNRYAAKSATRSMLLVRVACGKIFERLPLHHSPEYQSFVQQLASQQLASGHRTKCLQEKTRELLRLPKNRSCPDGYHSQLGVDISGDRKSKTEVVVNKNFQVYPAYRVTYRPGGALPDPLSRAGNDALKTFDEYKASDFDRQAQNVLL
jgi:serine/threonine protein kinase